MPTPQIDTATFRCWYKGLEGTEQDLGQPNTVTETWIIERKAEVSDLSNKDFRFLEDWLRIATLQGAVPSVGQRMGAWYPGAEIAWKPMTLLSRSFQMIENGRVLATYRWFGPFHVSAKWWATNPTSSTGAPVAYDLGVDYQTSYRATELFRSGFGVFPPATSDSSAEIGGAATIPGLTGQPFQIEQLRIVVRRAVDFRYIPQSQLMSLFTPQVNTLNDTAFMAGSVTLDSPSGSGTLTVSLPGFERGSVLLESINCVKTEGQYGELIFTYLHEDFYYFHEQIPQLDLDGKPRLKDTPPGPGATVELADVRWKRVPRAYTEHNKCFFDQSTYTGSAWVPASSTGYLRLAQMGWWGNL